MPCRVAHPPRCSSVAARCAMLFTLGRRTARVSCMPCNMRPDCFPSREGWAQSFVTGPRCGHFGGFRCRVCLCYLAVVLTSCATTWFPTVYIISGHIIQCHLHKHILRANDEPAFSCTSIMSAHASFGKTNAHPELCGQAKNLDFSFSSTFEPEGQKKQGIWVLSDL